MPYKIFISYSSFNKDIVLNVCRTIQSKEVNVFAADYSINYGSHILLTIENEINRCDLFVLLWSEDAKNSAWVQQEIGMAKAKRKPILPLLLDKGLELPAFIYGLKILPVYANPHMAYQWLQNHVFQKAKEKKLENNILGLSLAATILYLFNKSDTND